MQKWANKYKCLGSSLWLSVVFIVVLILACTTSYNTISNRNFNQKYNPSQQKLHPEYTIYMNSPTDVRLYFRIFPREFAYFLNEDSVAFAKASLFFRVTHNYNSVDIIDSLTKNFVFKKSSRSAYLGFVPLSVPAEGNYVVEVFLSDQLESFTTSSVLPLNVSGQGNSQSFQFLSQYASPNFYNYNVLNDSVRVRSDMFNDDGLNLQIFLADTILPESPDLVSNKSLPIPLADSTRFLANPDTMLIGLNLEASYLFTNKGNSTGRMLSSFNYHYPYVKTAKQMLSGLRYLCSQAEMEELYNLNAPKKAVDTFWLPKTNDLEKSRELIRVFYNRIQLANYYFSNFKEGWLTDQGMIFIICGAPAIVKTDQDGEHWYYGKGEKENMTFHFYTEDHPLFGTVYVLERSEIYSGVWYNAISTWRDGRIFSLNP